MKEKASTCTCTCIHKYEWWYTWTNSLPKCKSYLQVLLAAACYTPGILQLSSTRYCSCYPPGNAAVIYHVLQLPSTRYCSWTQEQTKYCPTVNKGQCSCQNLLKRAIASLTCIVRFMPSQSHLCCFCCNRELLKKGTMLVMVVQSESLRAHPENSTISNIILHGISNSQPWTWSLHSQDVCTQTRSFPGAGAESTWILLTLTQVTHHSTNTVLGISWHLQYEECRQYSCLGSYREF